MGEKKLKTDLSDPLLVELVTHDLGELLEAVLGLCVVALNYIILKTTRRDSRYWP